MSTSELAPVRVPSSTDLHFGVRSLVTGSKASVVQLAPMHTPTPSSALRFKLAAEQYTLVLESFARTVTEKEQRMTFRQKLHYFLLGASSITHMVPPSGARIRSAGELEAAASEYYRTLLRDVEGRKHGE